MTTLYAKSPLNTSARFRSYPSASNIDKIKEKILRRERLAREDGIKLYNYPNILELGMLANSVREEKHGNKTYFNQNFHLNATNVCEANCLFCSFARIKEHDKGAFTMTLEDARQFIQKRNRPEVTEIHIVNGLHSGLTFEYYLDLLKMIRTEFPNLHVKAFTAVEIHYFAQKYGMTVEETLQKLTQAGLMSLPGGGAEIFAPRVRQKICADKVDAKGWLNIHKIAHQMGLRSNATMLYGHIETYEERVDHMMLLRDLQDQTGGFQTFIPLAFHPKGNAMQNLPGPTGFDDLRNYAIARLMLDNFAHIKAYWVMVGTKIAQTSLYFGVNDIDGTVVSEKVYRMAGSSSPEELTREELEFLIREAGREPVERDTLYNVIKKNPERG